MNTITPVEHAQEATLAQMTELDEWANDVKALRIANAADVEDATAGLRQVKAKSAELESQRKEIVDPLNRSVRLINELFKKPLARLALCEQGIKGAILAYQERQSALEEKRLAEASAAAMAGRQEEARVLIHRATEAAPQKIQGLSTRDVYSFEITDASLLPREFLMADESAIGALVRAKRGDVSIPGVKVTVSKTLIARAGM